MVDMFRLEPRDIAATVGWAIVVASVFLQALYVRGFLNELDLILLFFGSAVVGAVIVDIEKLVLSFLAANVLAVVVEYFCLNLPVILQLAVAGVALQSGVVVMLFRSIFPIAIIFILFGGFLGSFVGERLNLR